jgi:5'-nucleotidase
VRGAKLSYPIDEKLVVGVASSALFDLAASDAHFRENSEASYRKYQEEHLDEILERGVAFPFIRRLLALNNLAPEGTPLVEVILVTRNDPDTGRRAMRSAKAYGLSISRAIFMQGRSPCLNC